MKQVHQETDAFFLPQAILTVAGSIEPDEHCPFAYSDLWKGVPCIIFFFLQHKEREN